METCVFYITHLVMAICAVIIIGSACPESRKISLEKFLMLTSDMSLLKKLKAIYRSSIKEKKSVKSLVINILNIGTQISNQLLK
ncbi:MAG: hypothetical protein M3O71_06530 [Bacteroidota bacterium]|nr:hypothetical protein [Bacteroidota bacterium]